MTQLLFAYFPIALLIYLMTKSKPLASSKALPLVALVTYCILYTVYDRAFVDINAHVISGLLLALTPISIIAGAIYLFKCMEVSGALETIKQWLNSISVNKVAQLMIIGWAFAFLIEGASGFGTPAAIAAPILYSLGFPAIRVAVFCLIMNTVPVTFGAVGTPIWFGLSVVDLGTQEIATIAFKSALINMLAAPFIVFSGLALVLDDFSQLRKNAGFVLLSVFSCTLPYLLISTMSVEFPALLGGFCGLIFTILLAKFNIGLSQKKSNSDAPLVNAPPKRALIKASFPIWGTVCLLIITRIQEIGLKSLLQSTEPNISFSIGEFGLMNISASLVFSLKNILGTDVNWSHSLLYVPSLLPFFIIGFISLCLFKTPDKVSVLKDTKTKLTSPFFALLGALVFVNLMMLGAHDSAVSNIGNHLASLTNTHWEWFAPFLGALGSFFSGSATISNLTFAGIQFSIAKQLSMDVTTVLALQSVGAALGNMVCINNIVAVSSILGLSNRDGDILKRTSVVMLLYGLIAGLVSVAFL